MNFSL
ncbi:hypothetical protein CGLO_13406 [Colletotrichum gloeosporioides Cg-14]